MAEPHIVVKGNRRTPLGRLIEQGDKPVDLTDATVRFYMNDSADPPASVVAETATGVTKHPTFTFTVDTDNNRIIRNDHRVEAGQQIVVASATTLPAGLSASTRYFAVNVTPNFFQVSLTPNGSVVDITSTGTGAHTYYVVGSVQYAFLAADVDTAGIFKGYFTVEEIGVKDTFPVDGHIRIEIREAGTP